MGMPHPMGMPLAGGNTAPVPMGMPHPMGMPPSGGMGMPGPPAPMMHFPYPKMESDYLNKEIMQGENARLKSAHNNRIAKAEAVFTAECRREFSASASREELRQAKDIALSDKTLSENAQKNIRRCYVQALSRLNKLSQRRKKRTRSRRKIRTKRRRRRTGSTRRFSASQHLIR